MPGSAGHLGFFAYSEGILVFAETQGFEPWRVFRPCLVSSEVLSTTQPRLHICYSNIFGS